VTEQPRPCDGPDLAVAKARARDRARAARRGVPPSDLQAASAVVSARLHSFVPTPGPQRIAIYAALPAEVDVDGAARRWMAEGHVIAYPRVDGPGRLVWHAVDEVPQVATGRLGIREPSADQPVVTAVDVMVVPGLAFDADGGRMGYGGGFYDRAIAVLSAVGGRPLVVGVCLDAQVVASVPRGPLDEVVDAVVTEAAVYRCPAGAGPAGLRRQPRPRP
jgi:5-formyltetrahydrofolate cyclo-ligase